MSTNIFAQVIGQIFRHFLTALAALLGAYGVTEAQQNQLVEAAVSFAVSLIIAVIVQYWGVIKKKLANNMIETAILAAPGTPVQQIEEDAKELTKKESLSLAKPFVGAFLLWCMVLTSTACPGGKVDVQSLKDNSKKVATYANGGVELTRELHRANFLTLKQKDAIADAWIALSKGGQAFDALVLSIERQYGSPEAVPKSEVEKLVATFDAEVVAAFLSVLKALKVPAGGSFSDGVETIKKAVLLIAGLLGVKKQTEVKIAAAVA